MAGERADTPLLVPAQRPRGGPRRKPLRAPSPPPAEPGLYCGRERTALAPRPVGRRAGRGQERGAVKVPTSPAPQARKKGKTSLQRQPVPTLVLELQAGARPARGHPSRMKAFAHLEKEWPADAGPGQPREGGRMGSPRGSVLVWPPSPGAGLNPGISPPSWGQVLLCPVGDASSFSLSRLRSVVLRSARHTRRLLKRICSPWRCPQGGKSRVRVRCLSSC